MSTLVFTVSYGGSTLMMSPELQNSWIDAILNNDPDRANNLLEHHPEFKTHLMLPEFMSEMKGMPQHVRRQCVLGTSDYSPDNALCLAAVCDARDVLQVMTEQGVTMTQTTHQGNTFIHCLIAYASIHKNGTETKVIETLRFMKSVLDENEYGEIILKENNDGLRPLELAAHSGTFRLFQFIYETRNVYLTQSKKLGLYCLDCFDVTDYVSGTRFEQSPLMAIMLLEEQQVGDESVTTVLKDDPMCSWIEATIYSNTPCIAMWALLRFSYLIVFFFLLIYAKSYGISQGYKNNITHSAMSIFSRRKDIDYTLFCGAAYVCFCASIALLVGFFQFILAFKRTLNWHRKNINGRRVVAVYSIFYKINMLLTIFTTLMISAAALESMVTVGHVVSIPTYVNTEVLIMTATLACAWDILYFLQLVPFVNLYVIAIQRMLDQFGGFLVVFILFFTVYVFGFYILVEDMVLEDSYYTVFRLMLNMVSFPEASGVLKFLHMSFIFMVVILLLNILIAILGSAYDYVYSHREIIMMIQTLSVALVTEPIMSKLFWPIHNYLRMRYMVREHGRFFITRIILNSSRPTDTNMRQETASY